MDTSLARRRSNTSLSAWTGATRDANSAGGFDITGAISFDDDVNEDDDDNEDEEEEEEEEEDDAVSTATTLGSTVVSIIETNEEGTHNWYISLCAIVEASSGYPSIHPAASPGPRIGDKSPIDSTGQPK